MRSSPLMMLVLVAAGLALIAVPLTRLTRAERVTGPAFVEAGDAAAGERVAVRVAVRFVHEPSEVVVRQDGVVVASLERTGGSGGGEAEARGEMRIVTGSEVELEVEAAWPEGTPLTALQVELEPDGHDVRRGTLWVEGAGAREWLTFLWP
jgi:hypothetical protein